MTNYRSVNNTKTQPGPTFQPIGDGEAGGKRASFYDEYVIPAAGFVANDTISFGPPKALRKADRVLAATLAWSGLGAGTSIALGDDGSVNRYITAVASNNAGSQALNAFSTGFGYKLTQDRDLIATIAGAAPTPGAKVQVVWDVLRP